MHSMCANCKLLDWQSKANRAANTRATNKQAAGEIYFIYFYLYLRFFFSVFCFPHNQMPDVARMIFIYAWPLPTLVRRQFYKKIEQARRAGARSIAIASLLTHLHLAHQKRKTLATNLHVALVFSFLCVWPAPELLKDARPRNN